MKQFVKYTPEEVATLNSWRVKGVTASSASLRQQPEHAAMAAAHSAGSVYQKYLSMVVKKKRKPVKKAEPRVSMVIEPNPMPQVMTSSSPAIEVTLNGKLVNVLPYCPSCGHKLA